MKKTDGHPPSKRRRVILRAINRVLRSGRAAVAATQLPSHVVGSLADDAGTPANPISLDDSTGDSNGGATISTVINNEIVSFYLLLFSSIP